MEKWNKWVPHLLTEKQMKKIYEICPMLLHLNESNPFLNRIITCDENWILYDNRKRPAEWIHCGSSPGYFRKPNLHPKKVLLTVSWSQAGLIHHKFLQTGEIITANKYCTKIEEMHKK